MGFIANDIITQVIDRSDIVSIIGHYTALKKAGRNFKALCPFHHEKTSSFVVNPDKQIFHCFGCGVGGNVIGFVMRQERMEFPEAVRFLADKAGIVVPEESAQVNSPSRQLKDEIYKVNSLAVAFFHDVLLTSKEQDAKAGRDYLKARGISLEMVKQFQLGFAPDQWDGLLKHLRSKGIGEDLILKAGLAIAREGKSGCYDRFRNRVIFPIFDIQSRPVAFGARAMNDTDGAKYINSPETPVYTKGQHLFGFQLTKTAAGANDELIVVEGYMDMIMPFCHGVDNIAASLGTALTEQQIRLIRRYTQNVLMLFDTDPAGQAAIVRSLDLLIDEGMKVRVAVLSEGEDPDSFIRQYGKAAFDERLKKSLSLFDYKFQWLAQQHDAASVEGRSQICQHMLNTINRHKDEVIKYELSRQLAQRLNLPEAVVFKQSAQLAKTVNKPVTQTAADIPAKPKAKHHAEQELLLALFLKDPAWVHEARARITPEDFSDGVIKDVIKELWQISSEVNEWSLNDLLLRVGDTETQALLTRLSSQEDAQLGEGAQVLNDCLARMTKERVKEQKQTILKSMRQAEVSNDQEALKALTEQLNALVRQ